MRKWIVAGMAAVVVVGAGVVPMIARAGTKPSSITFNLVPASSAVIPCLAEPGQTPRATATVNRGADNDSMTLNLTGFKSGVDFDLFTVQNSNKLANGNPDPSFTNFGLAWYQSDIPSPVKGGTRTVTIKTILLDQIFGFDPAVGLPPTNTFHVGFWFDNPLVPFNGGCEPGATSPIVTPFNGDHNAGPLAFITLPSATSGLGPLCTDPNASPPPACNP